MAPQDATMYWLSRRTRNDLFLVYCFADTGRPTEELRAFVAERSARIADLRVRAQDVPGDLDYPSWVPCDFAADQFVEHVLPEPDWAHVQSALGELVGTVLDASARAWRLTVLRGVGEVPVPGRSAALDAEVTPTLVAVLQMSHALADGRRAAEIARALFAADDPGFDAGSGASPIERIPGVRRLSALVRPADAVVRRLADVSPVNATALRRVVPTVPVAAALAVPQLPIRLARTAVRGYQAFRAQQQLTKLTAAGQLPPPGPGFPPSRVNGAEAAQTLAHQVRMIVCDSASLRAPGHTVTVVVLTAVSVALTRYLEHCGDQVDRLGAQVPMALPDAAISGARNNYRSLSVDLCIDEPDLRRRADTIAATLADRKRRARHPLLAAQDRVTAVVPAPLLHRDVANYPLDAVPDSIAGHTVVSSVDRGRADLTFGGGRVRFTGGFPAIGSVMRLTHGIHGLGETVTLSLHADSGTLPDLDNYADLLSAAVHEVAQVLK
ncbi:wax ester/triacylglycerol synthase domain-containing protein [Nocardia sp. NPDC049149]|uniref:wax ester/triacylglycerol synthase domain-containing protein n=1 Tax=Nocardia sp. NPDC049149 TaxID=3364315 RepID=UPI00371A4FA6